MTETIYTISDELRFRERFLQQKPAIPFDADTRAKGGPE